MLNRKPRARRLKNRAEASGLEPLEAILGHSFGDVALLRQALTHSSWTNQHPDSQHNERLEFLGDSVLGLAVTSYIYKHYPQLSEGQLSKLRAGVVSAVSLGEAGLGIQLDKWVVVEASAVQNLAESSILGNTIEAIIGAVYLDAGWEAARQVALRLLTEQIDASAREPGGQDWKSILQEQLVKQLRQRPRYEVKTVGTSANPKFSAVVSVQGSEIGQGQGQSKKQAEQAAAQAALDQLARDGQNDQNPA